jgi:hypothetical protein
MLPSLNSSHRMEAAAALHCSICGRAAGTPEAERARLPPPVRRSICQAFLLAHALSGWPGLGVTLTTSWRLCEFCRPLHLCWIRR